MAAKSFVKAALRNATMVVVFATATPALVMAAPDDATAPEIQNKNRSNFQYHNGSADEKRPYRRPNLDIDPTNLRIEELIERQNALEERIEALERLPQFSRRGQ